MKNIDPQQTEGVNILSDVQNPTMGCLTGTQLLITKYKRQKNKCPALLRAMDQSTETLF